MCFPFEQRCKRGQEISSCNALKRLKEEERGHLRSSSSSKCSKSLHVSISMIASYNGILSFHVVYCFAAREKNVCKADAVFRSMLLEESLLPESESNSTEQQNSSKPSTILRLGPAVSSFSKLFHPFLNFVCDQCLHIEGACILLCEEGATFMDQQVPRNRGCICSP